MNIDNLPMAARAGSNGSGRDSTMATPSRSPQELQRQLLSQLDDLCMLPAVANEALQLARDPDCTTDAFARIVERDSKLAVALLSLVNSALFATGAPVTSLKQAVVRLGFRQCRNIILTVSAASLMKSLPLSQEWIRELLWRHSFVTATAGTHLNRLLGLGYQGEEFTGGLLHDIGRSLLAVVLDEDYAAVDTLEFGQERDVLDIEQAELGTDHCAFGAWYATYSDLPEPLVAVIREHHAPAISEHPERKLIALVAAADHIANHLQRYETADGYVAADNPGLAVLSGFTGEDLLSRFIADEAKLLNDVLEDSYDVGQGPDGNGNGRGSA